MKTILKQLLFSLLVISAISCSKDGEDGLDGINGVDGIDGQDGADGQNATGLTYVYFTGDITDAEAITKVQNEIGSITQFVFVENTTQLTTLDLSGVMQLVNIRIADNEALTILNVSDLEIINQSFIFRNNPLVTTLNLPNLEIVDILDINGSANINATSLQQVDVSALVDARDFALRATNISTLTANTMLDIRRSIIINNNTSLSSLNLNSVTIAENINIFENSSLTTINLSNFNTDASNTFSQVAIVNNAILASLDVSSLERANSINIHFNSLLTAVNLPQFTNSTSDISIIQNSSLNTISIPLLDELYFINFSNNNLDSNAINSLLNQFVSITPAIMNQFIQLNGQQPLAPPTGQGITDKNTLITNGNIVSTD